MLTTSHTVSKIILALFAFFFIQPSLATPEIYTSRGMILTPHYNAQENTLEAFMGIARWNQDHPKLKIAGAEMHVVVVKPQNPGDAAIFVCSHDEDLYDETGQHLNLHNLTLQQIKSLQLKQNMDGVDYGRTRNFNFLPEMFDAFMKDQPPFMIWLNVKDQNYRPNLIEIGYTSTQTIKMLKYWRDLYLQTRNVDIFKYIIVSSDNPFITNELNKLSQAQGLDKQGLQIFADYADFNVPKVGWKIFFAMGGYEKLFSLNAHWVSLQESLITPDLIKKYHAQGKKIIGWEMNPFGPYFNQVDAALVNK